ncbi:hypothetical protein BX592_111161 [Paraburkholderia rhizosphaerae]|uniref:Uncharacterized protein n=1 Tax=Paraburkholderia rhizosphaerae TaxID=480658 RepID=A0A4R8LPQ8_9BURK|nr:hypothetical protein BX592_111161 [Paraburkholderia rhizosphaerae]
MAAYEPGRDPRGPKNGVTVRPLLAALRPTTTRNARRQRTCHARGIKRPLCRYPVHKDGEDRSHTSSATHPGERVLLAGEIRRRTQDRHCGDSFRFPDAFPPDRPPPFKEAMVRRFERMSVSCLPYFRTNIVYCPLVAPVTCSRPQAALPYKVFNSNGGGYGFRKVQRRQPNKPNVFLFL